MSKSSSCAAYAGGLTEDASSRVAKAGWVSEGGLYRDFSVRRKLVGFLSDCDEAFPERRGEVSSEVLEGAMDGFVMLELVGVVAEMEEEAVFVVASLVGQRSMVWLDMT